MSSVENGKQLENPNYFVSKRKGNRNPVEKIAPDNFWR